MEIIIKNEKLKNIVGKQNKKLIKNINNKLKTKTDCIKSTIITICW